MRFTSFNGLRWWSTFVTATAVLVPCVTAHGAQLLGLYTFEENSVAEVRDVGPMGNHPVDLSDPDCRTNVFNQACYPTSGGTIVADGFQGKGLSVSGEGSMGVTAENPVPTPAMRQDWADTGQTLYLPIDLNPPPGGEPGDARVATIGGWFKTRHLGFGQHNNPSDSPQRAGLWGVDNGGWDRGVMRDSNRYYVTGGEYVNTQAVNPDIVAIQDQWQFVAATFPTSTHWKIWVDEHIAQGNKQPLVDSGDPWIAVGHFNGHDDDNNESWAGELDNFFVFEGELTDGEIDIIRGGGVSGIAEVCECTLNMGEPLIGDMDCDGDIDFDDIDEFVLGLTDPTAYESNLGIPPTVKGDTDGDNDLDFDDITGFVALLSGGSQQAVPEPTSLALLGLGLAVFVVHRRAQRKRA